jgi:hypothetical protein
MERVGDELEVRRLEEPRRATSARCEGVVRGISGLAAASGMVTSAVGQSHRQRKAAFNAGVLPAHMS